MGDFLHLAWTAGTLGSKFAESVTAAAREAGFECCEATPTAWLGVAGPRPPALRTQRGDGLVLIGDVFDLGGLPGRIEETDKDRFAALCCGAWGRYVALARTQDGRVRSLFRDPSGAMEALAWTVDSLQVITSSTPDWLIQAANPRARIRRERLGVLIADPSAIVGEIALEGVLACGAGDVLDLDTREARPLWRPSRLRPLKVGTDEAAPALEACIDRATLRLSAGVTSAVAELSGGLDSAIVSRALMRAGGRVRSWVNVFSALPESDERGYARYAAEGLRGDLTYVERRTEHLAAAAFDATSGEARPSLTGQDVGFDRLMADACEALGVEALFTGKGGDAVFLHAVDGDVFMDLRRARGVRALLSPLLPALSRWTRTSAWSIARGEGRRTGRGIGQSGLQPSLVIEDLRQDGPDHAWLKDLEHLGPAKQRHVAAVVGNLGFQTRCRRSAAVDMIHPLTSQPVVELCLSLPTWVLATGGRDRGLARQAFAARLPPAIVERRSKGDYTAFFHREIAANLPFIRDYLLGGRLADLGVIDRSRLEASLDPDRLLWIGGPPELSRVLVVEAWVRRWERRLP